MLNHILTFAQDYFHASQCVRSDIKKMGSIFYSLRYHKKIRQQIRSQDWTKSMATVLPIGVRILSRKRYSDIKKDWIKNTRKQLFTYAVTLEQRNRASQIRIKARYCTSSQLNKKNILTATVAVTKKMEMVSFEDGSIT